MLSSARCPPPPLLHHIRLAYNSVPTLRRGRNLTERYRVLERSNRATSESSTHVSLLSGPQPSAPVPARRPTTAGTIAGFVVPEEPRVPADDECCMSGCAVCVYDLYEEALAAYKDAVVTLRAALSARHIPEIEWPAHIRTSTGSGKATHTSHTPRTTTEKSRDAVLGAFEEMERVLKAKRDRRAAIEAEKRARGDVLAGDGERVGLDLRRLYEGIRWVIFLNR